MGGLYMEILRQTIRIIDYKNNDVYVRNTPETFSEYVRQLVTYINGNTNIREYKTRSVNNEVISCVLDIINNELDEEIVTDKIDTIANRLLLKERDAQKKISNMNKEVQKGSLIQALLYDADLDKYTYLLAKVEHTDFVDDSDYSFKTGFSKDMKKLWKSCVFEIKDLDATEFNAKVYSDTPIKYWYDTFLELDQIVDDAVNTDKAFRSIDDVLKRAVMKNFPRDHMVIRNNLIGYFKSHNYIDYSNMVEDIFENYRPIELQGETMKKIIEYVKELPEKNKFDRQFNTVESEINNKIKSIYEVYTGIQLKITNSFDDLDNTIKAYRDGGNRYIRIKTNNEATFRRFYHE